MEMADRDILRLLTDLLERLGIQVRFEILGDDEIGCRGGHCRLKGQQLLIVDRRLTSPEKVPFFLDVLRQQNLEGIFIPPLIRRLLANDG